MGETLDLAMLIYTSNEIMWRLLKNGWLIKALQFPSLTILLIRLAILYRSSLNDVAI